MKKSPASKKSPKTTKRVTAKAAKKPAAKSGARKTAAKKKPAGARKVKRQEMAAFAFDPRLMSCGCCCPGAPGAGMCGEPEGAPKRGGKRRK